jgi:hypothetical protein
MERASEFLSDELKMRHIATKFVPRLLSSDQEGYRISVCVELKEQTENVSKFISNTITCDESWMFGHDAETKQQPSQWKTPLHRDRRKHDKLRAMSNQCRFFFTLKASCIRNLFQ